MSIASNRFSRLIFGYTVTFAVVRILREQLKLFEFIEHTSPSYSEKGNVLGSVSG